MASISIIGAGAVGQAVGKGFDRMGLDVVFYDVDKAVLEKLKNEGYEVSSKIPEEMDYYMICVPERYVEDVVRSIRDRLLLAKVIIKSTVPVGTTKKLWNLWDKACPIYHNPEFLVEATAERDFLEPNMVVLGSPSKYGRGDIGLGAVVDDLYWWVEPNKIIYTDSDTSEMVKLALNGYLSTVIGYWNDIHKVCGKLGVNSHEVGRICSRDPRITTYGAVRHGKSYAGKCLPKDTQALIELAKSLGINDTVFEKVQERNL